MMVRTALSQLGADAALVFVDRVDCDPFDAIGKTHMGSSRVLQLAAFFGVLLRLTRKGVF